MCFSAILDLKYVIFHIHFKPFFDTFFQSSQAHWNGHLLTANGLKGDEKAVCVAINGLLGLCAVGLDLYVYVSFLINTNFWLLFGYFCLLFAYFLVTFWLLFGYFLVSFATFSLLFLFFFFTFPSFSPLFFTFLHFSGDVLLYDYSDAFQTNSYHPTPCARLSFSRAFSDTSPDITSYNFGVNNLLWSLDGSAIVIVHKNGLLSLWSAAGCLLCSLSDDLEALLARYIDGIYLFLCVFLCVFCCAFCALCVLFVLFVTIL